MYKWVGKFLQKNQTNTDIFIFLVMIENLYESNS